MSIPHTTPPTNALALSVAEFALISGMTDVDPLVRIDDAPVDPLGAAAIFDGLRARGIIVRDDDGDSLAPPLRPLLGVALHAEQALCVSSSTNGDQEVSAVLDREVGVRVDRTEGEVLLLSPFDPAAATDLALALLELPQPAGESAAASQTFSFERYLDALQGAGEPAAVGSPLAAVASAVAGAAPSRRLDLRRAVGAWETITVYEAGDALAVVERSDDGANVTASIVSREVAATLVAARVAAFRMADA